MGRRQKRKQQRRAEQRNWVRETTPVDPETLAFMPSYDDDVFYPGARGMGTVAVKACGSCREFIEDSTEVGRGTCLHPASGVLSPWTDTPACPYYSR